MISSRPHPVIRSSWLLFLFLLLGGLIGPLARGEQFGDFTYFSDGTAITITRYTGAGGVVTIPDAIADLPVRTIGEGAFQYEYNIKGVTIPSSVTSLGHWAFGYCTNLVGITIPSSVSSIGTCAFAHCANLTDLEISNGVASIGDEAFSFCSNLTKVVIPESLNNIGTHSFMSCTDLLTITVDVSNPSYRSIGGVLFDKIGATLIQYPTGRAGDYAIPDGVASIEARAFFNCEKLTGITIPSSTANIGDWAFHGCRRLRDVAIPASVMSIGTAPFAECTGGITVAAANPAYRSVDGVLFDKNGTTLIQCPGGKTGNYVIPAGVIRIGEFAFSVCAGLTGITIPEGVTHIGSEAFCLCLSLTFVTIPSSVVSIANLAFAACENLTSATFEGDAPASFGSNVFDNTASSFKIYYYEGSTDFDSPAWTEYVTEAIPRPPELRVESITRSGGMVSLVVPEGQQGWTYELQRSENLSVTRWTTVETTGPLASTGPVQLTDSAASAPSGFYRVVGRAP